MYHIELVVSHIEWVMSHTECHTFGVSHVTHFRVLKQSFRTCTISNVAHLRWVTSHLLRESCRTSSIRHIPHFFAKSQVTHFQSVLPHICNHSCRTLWSRHSTHHLVCHGTHLDRVTLRSSNVSSYTTSMSHVTHHFQWVMSMSHTFVKSGHTSWMSHVTHLVCVISHVWYQSVTHVLRCVTHRVTHL